VASIVSRILIFAGMAELADVQDLESCVARRAGSNPVTRTKSFAQNRYMAEKASVYAGFGGFEWINSKPPIFIDAALFLGPLMKKVRLLFHRFKIK
jgi:hypothetical protein